MYCRPYVVLEDYLLLCTLELLTYREEHVLFVLVDSLRVRYGVCVFEDTHTLSGQDGLVDLQRGRVNLGQSNVSRNLITN